MVKHIGSQALADQENNAVQLRKAAGEWLKSMREARGLSQTELAELVGVDYYSFVSQIENGRGRIPAGRFAKWADALGMKRKDFVYHILRYYEPVVFELLFEEDEQQSA
ncbi:helix-turn-helix domain-containing protein [Microvirga tunisiensis]|uniref:Helix-turn-helix domain-containing protein n=2 Tax=Pannonibacter tanglangensis TaxID=2750084 RepID=A0A7X5F258_9HYPH|nr:MULTISPECIES: helix-turn-helix transcriptional regulator [unclassified Pannonibacter]NBN63778.1 helix-turn-helix domain-containing protein [Pannonibacter sp. XCT-34]NBN77425.1 helix-turn-helix domain-containing protein [Pannonibacter sp. XCT-53]